MDLKKYVVYSKVLKKKLNLNLNLKKCTVCVNAIEHSKCPPLAAQDFYFWLFFSAKSSMTMSRSMCDKCKCCTLKSILMSIFSGQFWHEGKWFKQCYPYGMSTWGEALNKPRPLCLTAGYSGVCGLCVGTPAGLLMSEPACLD